MTLQEAKQNIGANVIRAKNTKLHSTMDILRYASIVSVGNKYVVIKLLCKDYIFKVIPETLSLYTNDDMGMKIMNSTHICEVCKVELLVSPPEPITCGQCDTIYICSDKEVTWGDTFYNSSIQYTYKRWR